MIKTHQVYGKVELTGKTNGRFVEVILITRKGAGPSGYDKIWVGQIALS